MDDIKSVPFSNVQLELLKLFATNLSAEEIAELRRELARFYARKSIDSANKAWIEKELSNSIMDQWQNEDQ